MFEELSIFYALSEKIRAKREGEKGKFPKEPAQDVLLFLIEHAPLEKWERAVLAIIRDEAYYFMPQMQTKIMNEGWASYWHSKMMTEQVADASEIVDYADNNAAVMATSGGRLNPYKLGVELYRSIEERWDRGQFGAEWENIDRLDRKADWDQRLGLGQKKIFEVRALYNDVTFIDEFLTPEFAILKSTRQLAFSSVAIVAYRSKTGELVSQSGPFVGKRLRADYWIFGTGPNTVGDIPPAEDE